MKKNYRFITLSILAMFMAFTVSASHLVGGYISYEHISGNQYKLKLKLYRDCSGIPMSAIESINIYSATALVSTTATVTQDSFAVVQANSCIPTLLTTCQGGTAFGIEEYYYSGFFTFPSNAPDWDLSYSSCCRNSAITTLINPSSSFYTNTTLDNFTVADNNSPVFSSNIFNEFCAGVFSTIDYSCTDADGDSLVYRLDTCFDSPNVPLIYAPPYSPTNPIASFTPVMLNSTSGMLTFTPSLIQIGVVSMIVDEYRAGVKIGSMKRDDEIVILNGIQNPDIIYGVVYDDANNNGTQDAGENGIQGAVVSVQPGAIYASTDSAGAYTAYVVDGTYNVSIPNPPMYYSVNPVSYSPVFMGLGNSDSTNNFGMYAPPGITDLMVTATGYDGAVPGTDRHYQVRVDNIGTALASGTVAFTFDNQNSFVASIPAPASVTGNTISWNQPNLLPGAHAVYYVTLYLDSLAQIGDTIIQSASVASLNADTNSLNNYDYLNQEVVASFDPNMKEVSLAEITPQFIAAGNYLEYTIHFQNTGTSPAMNIHLSDPFDYFLDPGSFEFLASSHICNFTITQTGLLNVYFSNINLPDWNTDEPASHGFFKFRIKPKNILVPGNLIYNAANIFFDFNPAVTTNYCITHVFTETGISNNTNSISAMIYPNPAQDKIVVKLDNKEAALVQLYDLTGRVLFNQSFQSLLSIDLSEFSNGIYMVRISDKAGNYSISKVIKN